MIEFILNNETIETDQPSGSLLLDFIRYDKHLMGTKIGCREGDCGACAILIGDFVDGKLNYVSATSCLTPIGNIHGKHIVTIEGLNMDQLSPVQQSMIDESGTQCGFCTVGFVVALSGYCLEHSVPSYEDAIAAMDGNICRCTGYKSIERAAQKVTEALQNKVIVSPIEWLVANQFIPAYFTGIADRLKKITRGGPFNGHPLVGGGTDIYVQRPEEMVELAVGSINSDPDYRYISFENGNCIIGGGTTASDLVASKELKTSFPGLDEYIKLVSSSPIRNISTIAGNFVNASPIGDFTAFFLALNAKIYLIEKSKERTIYLKDFYKGYKELDKSEGEIISKFTFKLPSPDSHFNFEKISKREHLDIASVNSAAMITISAEKITAAHISAGGVGPTPKYLGKTCEFLTGKEVSPETVKSAGEIVRSEISPISDARGSADYKRLALRQLFYAHFIKLFPKHITLKSLTT